MFVLDRLITCYNHLKHLLLYLNHIVCSVHAFKNVRVVDCTHWGFLPRRQLVVAPANNLQYKEIHLLLQSNNVVEQ